MSKSGTEAHRGIPPGPFRFLYNFPPAAVLVAKTTTRRHWSPLPLGPLIFLDYCSSYHLIVLATGCRTIPRAALVACPKLQKSPGGEMSCFQAAQPQSKEDRDIATTSMRKSYIPPETDHPQSRHAAESNNPRPQGSPFSKTYHRAPFN